MTTAFSYAIRIGALAGACLLAACNDGREVQEQGSATVAKSGYGPKPEGVSRPDEAVTTTYYLPNAAVANLYEISAGKLALERSEDVETRRFAARMVADHEKALAALRRFVAENPVNIALPDTLDARHNAMIENLKSASSAEFDHVYIGQQAAAHQEAHNLQQSFATKGDNPDLQPLAMSSTQIIKQHRDMLAPLERRFAGR